MALVAYWHPGDQVVLKSVMSRLQVDPDGTSELQAQATQTITLKVLEETEDTYLVRISYSDIYNAGSEGDIVDELAAAITSNLTYDIQTDLFGVVQQLANPEQVLKAMRDKVPALVDGVLDRGTLDLDTTYYFDSEDTDQYYTYVDALAEADKDQMKPFAEAMGVDDLDLTMQEVTSLRIDLATGWPNDLYNKRTVHMVDPETGDSLDLVWETGLTDVRNIK